MPTWDFECSACSTNATIYHPSKKKLKIACPDCGKSVRITGFDSTDTSTRTHLALRIMDLEARLASLESRLIDEIAESESESSLN